jgi:hypothetical protein
MLATASMGADVILVSPLLALLLLAATGCAWVAYGDRARRRRQAVIADALRPRCELRPSPDVRD